MIVVNCRFLTQPMTGVQRYAEELVEHLASLRDDLVLVAPNAALRRDELAGLAVEKVGRHLGHRWEQSELPRFVRRQGSAAVLLSLTNTGPVLLRNQVVTHHDVTYVRFPQTYSRTFRVAYRALSQLTLRRARRVVTVSEFSRREISDVYGISPNKITVVPNAASSQFSPGRADEPATAYFLSVSSVLPHKNLGLLVRAYLDFADETGSSTRLHLIGSKIRMSAEHDPVPDDPRVIWLGRVTDGELVRQYRGARAVIFPSLYEGFGVPPLEAQACGAPVVSSNAASLPDVLRDSALFFGPTRTRELTNRLAEIDGDASLRRELREKGFANVSRYSWDASARLLSHELDIVVNS